MADSGDDIEVDNVMIEGALDLMAFTSGNRLDQETLRKAEQVKRMVAQRLEDEFPHMSLRIKFSNVPNESKQEQKIQRSDQPSTPRAEPGPSSAIISTEVITRPAACPSLPAAIQDLIGPCSMPIRKQIFASDVKHGLCRLMLPKLPVDRHLKRMHLNPNECIKKGIPVAVYGPDGREYAMIFKLWTGKFYVLKSKSWNQFCQDYGLRSLINMATLTIWMFRHRQTNDICFAITWLRLLASE